MKLFERNISISKHIGFAYKIDQFLDLPTISDRNIQNENCSKYSLRSQRVGVSLCFWPLPKISGRNWAFRAGISKTRIDRHVIFTEWNLMFLTTSHDFWQELNISSRNLKNENWSTWHIYRRKPYVFHHFPIFLAEYMIFDQKLMVSIAGRKSRFDDYWRS